jgi:hypothetical protein
VLLDARDGGVGKFVSENCCPPSSGGASRYITPATIRYGVTKWAVARAVKNHASSGIVELVLHNYSHLTVATLHSKEIVLQPIRGLRYVTRNLVVRNPRHAIPTKAATQSDRKRPPIRNEGGHPLIG